MNDLKVGVIGYGWVAGAHIETYKAVQGTSVKAVCDVRNLSPSEVQAAHGISPVIYTDYRELLKDPEIDIIDICTPNQFHKEQAVAAARAGKHIFLEKPIALTYADASAIRMAIRESGVKSCVGLECRFSKQFQLMKSVIDSGLLGQLHYGEIDYYHGIGPWYAQISWNIRKACGGSALLSAGVHALDALMLAMDDEVEEVTSYGTKSQSPYFADYEYPPTTVSILRFKSGRIGKVTASIDCLQPYYFHCHLVGSEGSLLDNKFYSARLPGMVKERWSTLETALVDSGDVTDHPYRPQFEAFRDSIINDTPMPLTDFETAFQSHRVIYAADLSVAEGRPVKLSELG